MLVIVQSLQLSLVKQAFATKVLCFSSFLYEALLRWKRNAKEYSEQRLFSYLKVGVYSNLIKNLITIISVLRILQKNPSSSEPRSASDSSGMFADCILHLWMFTCSKYACWSHHVGGWLCAAKDSFIWLIRGKTGWSWKEMSATTVYYNHDEYRVHLWSFCTCNQDS